ncbi:hypothetical protein [Aeromonas veronii]|uniref:hypothetical protein n=1 Tax=Aeromonas veronii TaxID=654 RepID=UPI001C626561|nr:hypothetical protein [Aeromonas veronii]
MSILTNKIDVTFNNEEISLDFDIYKIKTDISGKQNYGKIINKIYHNMSPLSLCSMGKGSYAVLLPKGRKYNFTDPHYIINKILPGDLPKSSCTKLLIGSLPHLTSTHTRSSEGAGLYYLSDIENIRGVEVLRAYEIKIDWESREHLVLKVEAATFTPIDYHKNADGDVYGDCTHLPRITFDRWTQELTRSKNGEFIKKRHRDKNMKSEMVSLDTKNPSKFWSSKMGILAMFVTDVQRYLHKYISIEFQTLTPEYRVRFKESNVINSYAEIYTILRQRNINVINFTACDVLPLIDALRRDAFMVSQSNGVQTDALNLAVHHEKEYYDSTNAVDPYYSLRSGNRVIIQSVYPGTILKEGKLSRTEYEACLKELFIKTEVFEKQLRLFIPEGRWSFITCSKPDENDAIFHMLTSNNGALSYDVLSIDDAQNLFLLDLYRPMKNGEHAVISLDTGHSFIFEETNYVALPKFQELACIMNELMDGYAHGIKRNWIYEFLDALKNGDVIVANTQLVDNKLSAMLCLNPSTKTFYKKDLFGNKDTKISYKGSLQSFFDWIAVEKGLRLGASLKAMDSGFIEASLGLFYNEDERLYFVGDKDNVKSIPRFCRMRRILTDADSVPISILKMMEVFHIRHKQATILPFVFKHLREFSLYSQE